METYLSTRPTSFPSRASGIEWHTRSRTIRNTNSARVSVPPLLTEESPSTTTSSPSQWRWRTDLSATKPFWENWFVGLSKKFLESRGGKLLLLAGTDRLDKELIIGQMQGSSSLFLLKTAPPMEKCSRGFSIITISPPLFQTHSTDNHHHRQIPTRCLP
jgi:protein phosphatase methylesterase 1